MNIQVNKLHEEMMEIIVEIKTAQDYAKWENRTFCDSECISPYANLLDECFHIYLQDGARLSVLLQGEIFQREYKEDGSIILQTHWMYRREVKDWLPDYVNVDPFEMFKEGMNKLIAYLKEE